MAYNEFAYYYDEFNTAADYDALYRYVTGELAACGVTGGLLADLGCGTGALTLMLAQAGYDVIGIDQSEEMLSVLREKADELGLTGRILLLRQDILQLDLYGTIRAAVSTFDTFSHIGPLDRFEQAIAKVGKPVALMNKDDKIAVVQYLNNAGAFLITKSGDKVSSLLGISKFTLYSYMDKG